MANPNKKKGDAYERAVRDHLNETGLHVERTRAGYQRDAGDLHVLNTDGTVHATIQCKNTSAYDWNNWLPALEQQRQEAKASYAVLVRKRRGIADPGQSTATMTLRDMARILRRLQHCTCKEEQ
jgi:Holliday junction resolvase-like predicted endonuclease